MNALELAELALAETVGLPQRGGHFEAHRN